MRRGTTSFRIIFVTLVCAFGFGATWTLEAQEGDPSDLWLRGYMLMREAEDRESEKRDLDALAKYREAQRLFDYIARTHPGWKTNMMNFRRKALLDKIEVVHERLRASNPNAEKKYREQNPGATVAQSPSRANRGGISVPANSEVVGGERGMSAESSGPVESIGQEFRKLQDQLDRLTGANQRLKAERDQREQVVASLENQLEQSRQVEKQLRKQLAKTLEDLEAAQGQGEERRQELEKQLKLATAELREANTESSNILKALESAKLQVEELTKQKNALLASRQGEMERAAQVMAQLEQTANDRDKAREERDAARAELKRLQAELERSKAEASDPPEAEAAKPDPQIAKELEASQRKNEELIAKLETQLGENSDLKSQNEELVAELKKSQATISTLQERVRELEEDKKGLQKTNEALLARQDQLIKERDLLKKERDEMAILLNARDQIEGDVKDILTANREWREELQDARRRTYELEQKEGDYRREIGQLRKQLSAMQEERDMLRTENERYQETVTQLNGKLEQMLAELERKTKALQELTGKKGRSGASASAVVAKAGNLSPKGSASLQGAREENELLKGIIREQLVHQAKAQQARQLVLEELEKMDFQSELLLTSLDDMAGQQINISEEVKKMFKGREEMQLIKVVEDSQGKVEKFASLMTSGKKTVEQFPDEGGPVIEKGMSRVELSPAARSKLIVQLAKAANYDFTRRQFRLAEKGYEQILAVEPQNVFALANMGLIHIQADQPKKAKDYLNRALHYDKTHAPTHYYLGVLHFKAEKYDEALEAFGKCLTHDRTNANAHNYIGLIATEKGWMTRAETEFRKAVEIDPEHAHAHFNLSVLYATKESPNKELARKHYRRARKLGASPDSAMEDYVNG